MEPIQRVLSDLGEAWERLGNKERVTVIGDLAARMTSHLEELGTAYLVAFLPGQPARWEYQLPLLTGTYGLGAGELQDSPLETLRQLVNEGRTKVAGTLAEGLTSALEDLDVPYLVLYHPATSQWPEHWEYRLPGFDAPLEF